MKRTKTATGYAVDMSKQISERQNADKAKKLSVIGESIDCSKNLKSTKEAKEREKGGYVLIKSSPPVDSPGYVVVNSRSMMKNQSHISALDPNSADTIFAHESYQTKMKKSKRRRLILIIIVIVGVVALFGFIGYLAHRFYEPDHDVVSATNLCEERFGECFYHKETYVSSCISTYCYSVWTRMLLGPKFENGSDTIYTFKVLPADDKSTKYEIQDIPNYVPCGRDSWCEDGECVQTNDEDVAKYARDNEKIPNNGTWKVMCNRHFKCMNISQVEFLAQGFDFFQCFNADCTDRHDIASKYGFYIVTRSCDNPMPSNNGYPCWKNDYEAFPLLSLPKTCKTCPSFNESLYNTTISKCQSIDGFQKCILRNCNNLTGDLLLPNGYPCRNMERDGLCFHGLCIPKADRDYCQ